MNNLGFIDEKTNTWFCCEELQKNVLVPMQFTTVHDWSKYSLVFSKKEGCFVLMKKYSSDGIPLRFCPWCGTLLEEYKDMYDGIKAISDPNTFVFFSDYSHGWLRVPCTLIDELGIESKISSFSYKDDTHYYLEEDQDYGVFAEVYYKEGREKTPAKEIVVDSFPCIRGVQQLFTIRGEEVGLYKLVILR